MRSLNSLVPSLLFLLHTPLSLALPHEPNGPHIGAVSSESDTCSRIGTKILEDGGNAADAMVATVFCVGVIGMYHADIGGGGFALIRKPDEECKNGEEQYEFVDFRESAPAAAFEDMYLGNENGSLTTGLASGIPGEVRGLQYIHEKYATLPWADLIQPSIDIARNGWLVNEDLLFYIASATRSNGDFITSDPQWAQDFAPNGKVLELNQTITRKRYADTLQTIAEEGPDAFYEGYIAETMVAALQANNGTMTLQDLKDYKVEIRDITQIDYRGWKVHSVGAPGGGPVALATLKILEGYAPVSYAGLNVSTHRLDEATKFAYGMRTELGDPLFLDGVEEYVEDMISEEAAAEVRSRISDQNVLELAAYNPKGLESLDTPGTAHLNTADASGMAISLTTTVNLLFGSKLVVPETGIVMNNEMNDFSIPGVTNAFGYIPSPANYVRPGKRPLSSMTPTIVEAPNGQVYLVVGAAGGSRIITATIQNIWNVLDRGMTAPQALAEPRLHDQLVPQRIVFDYEYDNSTVEYLRARGHNISFAAATGTSTASAIRILLNGTFEASGEPRLKNTGGFAV